MDLRLAKLHDSIAKNSIEKVYESRDRVISPLSDITKKGYLGNRLQKSESSPFRRLG
jgi:hypothetical protein